MEAEGPEVGKLVGPVALCLGGHPPEEDLSESHVEGLGEIYEKSSTTTLRQAACIVEEGGEGGCMHSATSAYAAELLCVNGQRTSSKPRAHVLGGVLLVLYSHGI